MTESLPAARTLLDRVNKAVRNGSREHILARIRSTLSARLPEHKNSRSLLGGAWRVRRQTVRKGRRRPACLQPAPQHKRGWKGSGAVFVCWEKGWTTGRCTRRLAGRRWQATPCRPPLSPPGQLCYSKSRTTVLRTVRCTRQYQYSATCARLGSRQTARPVLLTLRTLPGGWVHFRLDRGRRDTAPCAPCRLAGPGLDPAAAAGIYQEKRQIMARPRLTSRGTARRPVPASEKPRCLPRCHRRRNNVIEHQPCFGRCLLASHRQRASAFR